MKNQITNLDTAINREKTPNVIIPDNWDIPDKKTQDKILEDWDKVSALLESILSFKKPN